MKKIIYLFVVASVMSTMISCSGGKSENAAIIAPQGMNVLELNKYGKPFAIFIPDTTSAKLEIIQQSYGALDIKVGKNFAISINEQAADIELRKKDIKEDEVNKLTSFVVEEPTAIMWESAITQPEFHFLINQKIDNTEYSFEEIKDSEAAPFGKEAIQKMFDSCKNVKETKKGSAS